MTKLAAGSAGNVGELLFVGTVMLLVFFMVRSILRKAMESTREEELWLDTTNEHVWTVETMEEGPQLQIDLDRHAAERSWHFEGVEWGVESLVGEEGVG